MSESMVGQIAVVAGGGSGIGAASARAIAAKGAHVVICDLRIDNAEKIVSEIKAAGGAASARLLDATKEAQVHEVINSIHADHGAIHAFVNAVGITGPTGIAAHLLKTEDFVNVFNVNLFSAIYMNAAVLPHMIKAEYGRIMHVASISGKDGNPNMAPYSTSKAAMIGFVKATAKEVATKGVTINSIAPAVVRSPINENTPEEVMKYMISRIPMGRIGEASEAAEMIAFVVSPACSFTTGFVFDLSGGRATY
jgi:3-oxoacyl-[acyl-carrier protein] reductase